VGGEQGGGGSVGRLKRHRWGRVEAE